MKRYLAISAALAALFFASSARAQFVPPSITSQEFAVASGVTGTTAGATATLPAVQGRINWLCGVSVSPGSATTAITITIGTNGLVSNLNWNVGAPVTAVGVTGAIMTANLSPCIPATGPNVAITVTAGALGAGGVGQNVNAWGYSFPANP